MHFMNHVFVFTKSFAQRSFKKNQKICFYTKRLSIKRTNMKNDAPLQSIMLLFTITRNIWLL